MGNPAKFDRDAALNEAMLLFWEKGFASTSTRDIQSRLDMRPASIYAAFGDKQSLFIEALRRYVEVVTKRISKLISQTGSPTKGLSAFFRETVGLGEDKFPHPLCFLNVAMNEAILNEDVLTEVKTQFAALNAVYAEVLSDAIKHGELDAGAGDISELATRIQLNLMSLRTFACIEHDPRILGAAIDNMLRSAFARG